MSKWLKYNISQQTYSPKTVNDVITDKYDIVHNDIFNEALSKAIMDNLDKFYKHDYDSSIKQDDNIILVDDNTKYINLAEYRISEILNHDNYILPTKVMFVNRKKLLNRFTLDLSNYWDSEYELQNNFFDSSNIITKTSEDWYQYNDIINYDYINGKATIENRVETKKRKIDFSKVSTEDNIKIDYQL